MAENTQASRAEEQPGLLSKMLKVLSFPIAAVSGYWAANVDIRKSVYENAKSHGLLENVNGGSSQRLERMQEIGQEALEEIERNGSTRITLKTKPFHDAHRVKTSERFEKLGLGSVFEQWKFMRPDQKQTAIINGMTVAGVAIGALFAIANSKAITHIFSKRDAAQNPDQGPSV